MNAMNALLIEALDHLPTTFKAGDTIYSINDEALRERGEIRFRAYIVLSGFVSRHGHETYHVRQVTQFSPEVITHHPNSRYPFYFATRVDEKELIAADGMALGTLQ